MTALDRIRYAAARWLVKRAGLSIVPNWMRAGVITPSITWLIRDGYQKNAVVFACISTLALDYPEAPLRVYESEASDAKPLDTHPLRILLRRPNAVMGERELAMYTVAYAAIGGNAYWHIVRDTRGRPAELWPYHAGQMRVVPGGEEWVKGYEFTGADGQAVAVERADVIHFKWPSPDPTQPWQAQPPLMAVAAEVDADNEMTRYLRTLLRNDAVPRTILRQSKQRHMEPEEVERTRAQFGAMYRGDGAGGVLILEAGVEIQRLGLDFQELNFEALHRVPESRIAAVLRVPLSVAGVGDDPTYANSDEAYRRYSASRVALWRLWGDEVQNALGDGAGVSVRHDTSGIAALQEDQNAKWTRVNQAVGGGYLLLNEARRALGFGALDGGDVLLWPATAYAVPVAEIAAAAQIAILPAAAAQLPAPARVIEARASDVITERKARASAAARRTASALQRLRRRREPVFAAALEEYFSDLAETMAGRARGLAKADALPTVAQLLLAADGETLLDLVSSYYLTIIGDSWELWGVALGVEAAFETSDPAVVAALETAATQVRGITETTRDAVRDILGYAAAQGWELDRLVNGDGDQPGLRDMVAETYRGRATTISRSELATAQNTAAAARFGAVGVDRVVIFDGGSDDSDDVCNALNGTVQTLAWFQANPIQHPNCVRAAAPYLE